MPNHAHNEMVVYGNLNDLQEFLSELTFNEKGETCILHRLFPTPQELLDTESSTSKDPEYLVQIEANISKYGVPTWFEWRQKFWGSKWGDYETKVTQADSYNEASEDPEYYEGEIIHLRFLFYSAWCAPVAGFDRVSKMFPNLTFEIITTESGFESKHRYMFKNGHQSTVALVYDPIWDWGKGG